MVELVEKVLSTSNIEHCEGSTLRGISENFSHSIQIFNFLYSETPDPNTRQI